MSSSRWALRYAPHIGFLGRPLFRDLVGSDDPVEQIAFIASRGFAGIQDPMGAWREPAEQARIGEARARHGLDCGCFIMPSGGGPVSALTWGAMDGAMREAAQGYMRNGIDVARRLGSRHIVILSALEPKIPRWIQLAAMAENLRPMADLAAEAGLKVVLEAINGQRLPGMLLNHISEAAAVVRMAAHPAVRMVFDTGHAQAMDGDLLANLDAVWDLVDLVQIADHPGRVEPGMGEINFETFLAHLVERGFSGLCELEHLWSREGADIERAGLSHLEELDGRARARARGALDGSAA